MHCCDKIGINEQLCQIRKNWIFFMIAASLYSISYTSVSSSFHQYVTNPTISELNYSSALIEPGLGQSEFFYSLVITLFNIGAFIGALGSGLLLKLVPYWHLMLLNLLSHVIGYILYAISYNRWLIMISKLLSGIYIGGEMTLSLAYFAESSVKYSSISAELGRVYKNEMIRRKLFAWHNIGVGVGYILGPGAAALFSLFDIDQFRTIAWYNAAFGVVIIILLIMLFREDYSRKCIRNELKVYDFKPCRLSCNKMELFILFCLILYRGVLSFRFGVYETIFNPVLGDYFGFDERRASYFFFALVISQISGTLLLLFLQQIKLSSRIVAIIGLIMSIASCALLADWQSIGNDKCTTFSGYHHSNLTKYHNSTIIQEVLTSPMEIKDVQIDIDANLKLDGKIVLPYLLKRTMTCTATNDVHNICRRSLAECIIVEKYASAITSDLHRCPCNTLPHIEHVKAFKCGKEELLDIFLCLYVNTTYYNSRSRQLNPNEAYIESQSSKNLMTKCKEAKFEGHSCYWIPQSIVTKTYCEDCSPICRNLYQSLNFIQFCFGCALLMLAIPVAWVPVASIVSDKVDSETQGIVMGVVVSLTAIGRSVSPLWLDAAYEGMMKRTFLAMIIMILVQAPFLLFLIVFYRQLGSRHLNNNYKELLGTAESSDDDD